MLLFPFQFCLEQITERSEAARRTVRLTGLSEIFLIFLLDYHIHGSFSAELDLVAVRVNFDDCYLHFGAFRKHLLVVRTLRRRHLIVRHKTCQAALELHEYSEGHDLFDLAFKGFANLGESDLLGLYLGIYREADLPAFFVNRQDIDLDSLAGLNYFLGMIDPSSCARLEI